MLPKADCMAAGAICRFVRNRHPYNGGDHFFESGNSVSISARSVVIHLRLRQADISSCGVFAESAFLCACSGCE
jgi:hypothetical protein